MRIIVVGASVTGLAAAIALSDRGHEVHVVERDPVAPPEDAAEAAAGWHRPTVPQAAHSHAFASLGTNLLRDRMPDVHEAVIAAGAGEVRLTDATPPTLGEVEPAPGDEDLRMLTCRRSVFEWALLQRARARTGVTIERGVAVRGLLRGDGEENRVTGVVLEGGRTLTADLVLDASGRRSAAHRWLDDAGLPGLETTSESCRIVYYTRYYKRLTPRPAGPLNRGFGAGGLWDSYTAVLFLGDNDTFSISIGVLPDDHQLKGLREEEAFTATIRATPLLAPWVAPEAGEPISPVYAMGGLDNSLRLPDPAGPVVVGFHGLGDAVCTTNPAYGRGISLALKHVFLLADLLDEHAAVHADQARDFVARTGALVRPWLAEAIANDRGRAALWQASVHGTEPPRPPAGVVTFGAAVAASALDAAVWRQVARVMMMLDEPDSLYASPEVGRRIGQAFARLSGPPPMLSGAGREQLLAAVSVTEPA